MAQPPIRLLIVDDHPIFSASLARLLESEPALLVVGVAATLGRAMVTAAATQPDVVLMDFQLPDGDGPAATARLKSLHPSMKVIMLTARVDEHAVAAAMAAGCSGFVRKEDAVETLLQAIVAVHGGGTALSPEQLASLVRQLHPVQPVPGRGLTPRQREILTLSAAGLQNKEIARHLGLRLNTVRNHVQKVLNQLGVHSKLEAVATAMRAGIIAYPIVQDPDRRPEWHRSPGEEPD